MKLLRNTLGVKQSLGVRNKECVRKQRTSFAICLMDYLPTYNGGRMTPTHSFAITRTTRAFDSRRYTLNYRFTLLESRRITEWWALSKMTPFFGFGLERTLSMRDCLQTSKANRRDKITLHTEPRAARLSKTMTFAAAR